MQAPQKIDMPAIAFFPDLQGPVAAAKMFFSSGKNR